jgi:hypothetical protein
VRDGAPVLRDRPPIEGVVANCDTRRTHLERCPMKTEPMSKTRDDYATTIDHISVANSPVGIDAQLTHAIIIDYLQQIVTRLAAIEEKLDAPR